MRTACLFGMNLIVYLKQSNYVVILYIIIFIH